MRNRTVAAAIAGLLTLAACNSAGSSTPATVPADANLVVIAGPGIRYDKTAYSASAGTVKIALVNHDAQTHTLDIIGPDGTKIPGELKVGKSGDVSTNSFTLAAGTYKIVCLIPGHNAMKATLTIG